MTVSPSRGEYFSNSCYIIKVRVVSSATALPGLPEDQLDWQKDQSTAEVKLGQPRVV